MDHESIYEQIIEVNSASQRVGYISQPRLVHEQHRLEHDNNGHNEEEGAVGGCDIIPHGVQIMLPSGECVSVQDQNVILSCNPAGAVAVLQAHDNRLDNVLLESRESNKDASGSVDVNNCEDERFISYSEIRKEVLIYLFIWFFLLCAQILSLIYLFDTLY